MKQSNEPIVKSLNSKSIPFIPASERSLGEAEKPNEAQVKGKTKTKRSRKGKKNTTAKEITKPSTIQTATAATTTATPIDSNEKIQKRNVPKNNHL